MSESARMHILVSGRVQGVGYRFFVVEEAESHGLSGWVRNLSDGRVEAEVDGPPDTLEKFVERLRTGPRSAQVTNITSEGSEIDAPHRGFRIRSDG